MIYLTPLLTTLAYLMGERSVVSATVAPRTDFIQAALEDAYHAFPWRFARRTASITPVFGTRSYSVTLPSTYDYQMKTYAHYFQGTTRMELVEIDPTDSGSYKQGDNVYWINSATEGVFTFNTFESVSPISFVYQNLPPVLDSAGTIGSAYPSKMTIAKGARVYVKLGQNPDADVSQEESQFQSALANDIATYQVPAARRKRRTVTNTTGDF